MSLKETLSADMREAMKQSNRLTLTVLRSVIGEIQTQEKAGKTSVEFDDAQVLAVLTKEAKKRRESAEIYTKADAKDRAATETAEAVIIEGYLPTQLTEDEVAALVDAAIAAEGATTLKDMGKVVKAVLAEAEGRTTGKVVSTLVRARLG